ncbi:MAG: TRAP transporter substrate-binding protein [Rhodocyclaceae bacterium]
MMRFDFPWSLGRVMRACLGASVLACAAHGATAAPAVTLRMYSSLPADANSAHYVWFERFKANLQTQYKGAIQVNYFPNAMLGKEADAIQQVRLGAIDMMVSGTSIWSTLAPEVGVLDLGYLFEDWDQVGRSLDGKAGTLVSEFLMNKANVKPLGFGYSLGARNVFTRKPVAGPTDLKNRKIRVLPVPNFIATVKAMGATPIPMPLGEVYSGLQMGVIDGLEHDSATALAGKYYEVAKYGTLTKHVLNPIVININKASFERIPAAMRDGFLQAAAEATAYERKQAVAAEAKAIEDLKARGMTINETDRGYFRQAVKPVWDEFAKQYPTTAPILQAIQAAESK